MLTTPAALVVLVLSSSALGFAEPEEGAPSAKSPAWLDDVQTYCIVPVLPERAHALHASVNGVWGGIGGIHSVLAHTETVPAVQAAFGDDGAAFVRACHAAGLLAAGCVNGLEGFGALRERWPGLESMACRNAAGAPAASDDGMLLMCTNNPAWVQCEIELGKEAIRQGADLVLVDTPMSSAFIAGFLGGGFCPHCMAAFENYMRARFGAAELKDRFDLEELDREGVVGRLSAFQFMTNPLCRAFLGESPDARLFQEFIHCQEEASFETRKALIGALRAFAAEEGREIAFCTNAADLGTGNPGGHWIRGLMFADLFDLFVYEQGCLPDGMPFAKPMRMPRGKWAAFHKLAHAIYGRRSAAVLHAHHMGQLLGEVLGKQKSFNTWMAVQSAEAYAANGAYVQYYVEPEAGNTVLLEKCWARSAEHAAFVRSHQDLFAGDLRSGSPLAFLFLFNERGRTIPSVFPSYLGLAQAFVEGSRAFDVVFAGDGRFVQDRLAAEQLKPYETLIVPSPIDPTGNQQRLVRDFVNRGGTLVCAEPERLGLGGDFEPIAVESLPCLARGFKYGEGKVLVLAGDVTATATGDEGASFFKTYSPARRDKILALADRLGQPTLLARDAGGLACAFPVLQPEKRRLIVHLVNYDVDYENDTVRPKENMLIRVPRPPFLTGDIEGVLCAPGSEDGPITLEPADETVGFCLPRLGIYACVVIWAK